MRNPQVETSIDLSRLPKDHQAYIQQCIADSEALRMYLDGEGVPHWRAFFQLGQAYIAHMSDEPFASSVTRANEASELLIIWRNLGHMIEHVETNKPVSLTESK